MVRQVIKITFHAHPRCHLQAIAFWCFSSDEKLWRLFVGFWAEKTKQTRGSSSRSISRIPMSRLFGALFLSMSAVGVQVKRFIFGLRVNQTDEKKKNGKLPTNEEENCSSTSLTSLLFKSDFRLIDCCSRIDFCFSFVITRRWISINLSSFPSTMEVTRIVINSAKWFPSMKVSSTAALPLFKATFNKNTERMLEGYFVLSQMNVLDIQQHHRWSVICLSSTHTPETPRLGENFF